MNDLIEKLEKNGYTLAIYRDEDPTSPRDWDNLGTLYVPRPPRGCRLSDKEADAADAAAAPVSIPVYILDHSGIAVSDKPFGCPWDSWLAGCMYVTTAKLAMEYGGDTPEARKKAEECIRCELRTYAEYVAGDVYGYTITRESDGELIDSCWGYYGDGGIADIKAIFEATIKRQYEIDNPLFAFAGITA